MRLDELVTEFAADAPREPAEGVTAKPASGRPGEADSDAMMVFSGVLRV